LPWFEFFYFIAIFEFSKERFYSSIIFYLSDCSWFFIGTSSFLFFYPIRYPFPNDELFTGAAPAFDILFSSGAFLPTF
jgi:hypothetical protein